MTPPLAGPAIQGALGASGGVSVAPLCNAGRSMHVGRVRVGAGPSPGAGSGCLVRDTVPHRLLINGIVNITQLLTTGLTTKVNCVVFTVALSLFVYFT